jgi:hypothetical protein
MGDVVGHEGLKLDLAGSVQVGIGDGGLGRGCGGGWRAEGHARCAGCPRR